jgi:ankyrin repeat protein
MNPLINVSLEHELPFRISCERGHLQMAQWLLNIKPTIQISIFGEYAFTYACQNGHLHVAQWLLEVKPNIEVDYLNYSIFINTCKHGQLQVAQWLYSLHPEVNIENVIRQMYILDPYFTNNSEVVLWLRSIQPELLEQQNVKYTRIIETCPICNEHKCNVITCCNHAFCKECLSTWYTQKKNCPYCRENQDTMYMLKEDTSMEMDA